MKKLGLFVILGLATAFGEEFSFDSFQPVMQEQPKSDLLRYVSVDLAAIPSLQGVMNVGLRQEGEKHGYDLGISGGKAKTFTCSFLYGSYLRFIDASDTAKYYTGLGLRGGAAWGTENHVFETSGLFSAGRSYLTKSGSRQFFEINLHWPRLDHFNYPVAYKQVHDEVKYKKTFFNYQNIQFAVFYGWFF